MTFCIDECTRARPAGAVRAELFGWVRHYRARPTRYSLQRRANHESGKPKLKKIVPKPRTAP
ncbi:hypothetical protein DB771_28780 [Burkholderia sp. AU29985]|nr:hypothetical protein EGY28_27350 [Burkholderia dolosa]PUA73525.1 hypothetical protein DB771_28780 [Burkholderia sp. AU29985]